MPGRGSSSPVGLARDDDAKIDFPHQKSFGGQVLQQGNLLLLAK
jgi:hypothetical protein